MKKDSFDPQKIKDDYNLALKEALERMKALSDAYKLGRDIEKRTGPS